MIETMKINNILKILYNTNSSVCELSKTFKLPVIVSIIKTPGLPIDRLDELFIKFWTLEGAVTYNMAYKAN